MAASVKVAGTVSKSFKEWVQKQVLKKKTYIIFFKCDNTSRKIDVKKDEWVLLYNSLYSEVRYDITPLHLSLSHTHTHIYSLSFSLTLSPFDTFTPLLPLQYVSLVTKVASWTDPPQCLGQTEWKREWGILEDG